MCGEHPVEVVLRICLHAQVASGIEEVVHCAGQVECCDFVSVAGKDAVDGQVADAEREDRVGFQGQIGLWIVVRQYATNGDDWTSGDIHLWGACLRQGNDPQQAYARTWATQAQHMASGISAGPTVIAAADSTTSPLKIHGPGSNLADSTLLELTANGELILAGGSGNGYRFAELMGAPAIPPGGPVSSK